MADIADNVPFTNPETAISQGKRHLLVRDYTMAVTALAQACELLAKKHGDTADELGEPYLLYGRALLGLAREEAGVLGGGVPGSEESQENEDCDDDDEDEMEGEGDEENLDKITEDEKEENEENEEKEDEDMEEDKEVKEEKDKKEGKEVKEEKDKKEDKEVKEEKDKKEDKEVKENEKEKEKMKEKEKEKEEDEGEKKKEETKEEKKEGEKKEEDDKKEDKKTDDKENIKDEKAKSTAEEAKQDEKKEEPRAKGMNVLEGEGKAETANDAPSSKQQNGDIQENGGEEDSEEIANDEEDEVNNLQVAWEVLELAKLVLLKRGPPGWKLLADSHRLLGEVAMEGGNHKGALHDLQGCLDLLEKIEPREPRAIAEIHYQLGLAHSLGNDFDASIEEFNKATMLLESRIKELEGITEAPKTDDPFYTIEGEIQELKDLLPEIQEKISDMKDFKQEACKLVIESIRSEIASGSSNGAGPSSSDASSGSSSTPKVTKPVSDISHLVRKKRKADESETDINVQVCKKPTPEKSV